MNIKNITYFNDIDLDSDDYFSSEVLLDNNTITLDIMCLEGFPDYDDWVILYENYISKIEENKTRIDRAIVKDFKDEGTTLEYIEHHIEELDDLTIDKLLESTNTNKTKSEQLLELLKLQRIGFHFDKENFAVWNYSLSHDITDHILVVYTDKNGKVTHFSIDS